MVVSHSLRAGRLARWAVLCGVCGFGCQPMPREPTVATAKSADERLPQDPKSTLPRPDAVLIRYDSDSRTLTLYDLPNRDATWMLATNRNLKGEPVPMIYWFGDEVDPSTIAVFYTTSTGQQSPRITLEEIRLAQHEAVSTR